MGTSGSCKPVCCCASTAQQRAGDIFSQYLSTFKICSEMLDAFARCVSGFCIYSQIFFHSFLLPVKLFFRIFSV